MASAYVRIKTRTALTDTVHGVGYRRSTVIYIKQT